MALTRWIRAALLAVSGATLTATPTRAQLPPPSLPPAISSDVPADAQALVAHDLAVLNDTLLSPNPPGPRDETPQQRREEAARRLLSRPSPQAAKALLDDLQNPTVSRDAKTAIVRAIAEQSSPDPILIAPLLPLLGTERALSDAAARALARFTTTPGARERLIAFAQAANQPPAMRIGVIRALGGVISRDVTDALVALVSDPNQLAPIQNAAGDALLELTGQTTLNHDSQLWKKWQLANASKQEIAWRADIMSAREARLVQNDRAQADFINEMKQILDEQYQANPAGQGPMMLRLLNSPEPHTRAMGVQRVIEAHESNRPYPAEARKRLENLVGDSDTAVRFIAAQAIHSINYTDAAMALLTQLPQETNVDVKVAQIEALEPMKSMAAIPILRDLLHDPSLKVASAAAKALRALSSILGKQNPGLMHDTAVELWQTGIKRKGEPGGEDFRVATMETVGALGDRQYARELLALLNVDNNEHIRIAALHALGSIGDRDTSFQIAQWLRAEPSPAVRIEAIKALGKTSTFEDAAQTLRDFMSTKTEPNEAVQKQAWEEFESLLPKATSLPELSRWQAEFQSDATRRLPILLAYNNKLQERMMWEDLAAARQNTGETYLALKDPAHAALQFEQALDFWQKRRVANQVTVQLVKQLLTSLLASKQYDKATDFAGKQITIDPSMQTIVGPIIRDTATNQYNAAVTANDPEKMKDSQNLIDSALKTIPPLLDRYQTDLKQLQADLQQRLKTPKKP